MKKKRLMIIILSIVILGISAGIITLNVLTHVDENSICENVYIDTLNIGNMTKEQAREALDTYISGLKETKVTINVNENDVTSTLGQLGLTVDEKNCIDEALKVGKTGNIIKRFKALNDTKSDKTVFDLEIAIDDSKVNKLIKKCQKYDIKPKNSVLTRENGIFTATESQNGVVLAVDDTKAKLKDSFTNWNRKDDIVIEANVTETEAKVTKEKALLCNSVLGTFSTSFSSSNSNRRQNVQNGAGRINGTVLYPGDEFSTSDAMGPYEESNGYALAGSYSSGKVVESFGGGVCQVSTTLYNALLLAELEITERFNHSMTVSYVEPAADAAIAGNYKDLKFKNNTDAPIYIESYTAGGRLYFKIWGHETRAENRTVKYVSEVETYIEPAKDVITKDETKPESYRKVESNAHRGCRASLYKIVYIDGVEESREKVNTSSYAAAPNYITVGTKKEEKVEESPSPSPSASGEPGTSNKPSKSPDANATKEPEASKKPETSKAPAKTPEPTKTPKASTKK